MFDDDDGIARVDQRGEHFNQLVHVRDMQAGRRLVEHVDRAARRAAGKLGDEVRCFMAEPETARMAEEAGTTRAAASMERAAELEKMTGRRAVFAIGNAPTALIRLCELADAGRLHPLLVVGVPVGFVNVVPAKEMLLERAEIPSITARGRKGGSTVAAAVMNALLYMAGGR